MKDTNARRLIRVTSIVGFLAWLFQVFLGLVVYSLLFDDILDGRVKVGAGVLFSSVLLLCPFSGFAAALGLWKRANWSWKALLAAMAWYALGLATFVLMFACPPQTSGWWCQDNVASWLGWNLNALPPSWPLGRSFGIMIVLIIASFSGLLGALPLLLTGWVALSPICRRVLGGDNNTL